MTLMINARPLFFGISMLDKYKGTGWKKFYLIFGMCDESFSINYTAAIPADAFADCGRNSMLYAACAACILIEEKAARFYTLLLSEISSRV